MSKKEDNPNEITFKQTKEVTIKFAATSGDFTQVYHSGLQDYIGGLNHAESYKILFWLMPDLTMDGKKTLVDSIRKMTISTSKADYDRYYSFMMNKWGNAKGYRMFVDYIKELATSNLIISPQSNGEFIMNPFIFWQGDSELRYKLCKQLNIKGDWSIFLPKDPKAYSDEQKKIALLKKGIVFFCKSCGTENNTKRCLRYSRGKRTIIAILCDSCGYTQNDFTELANQNNKYLER